MRRRVGVGADPSEGRVRRHVRRVAVIATIGACGVYLAGVAVADVVVLGRVSATVNARLDARMGSILRTLPPTGVPPSAGAASVSVRSSRSDLDDAPVFSWWAPTGSRSPRPLERADPPLAALPRQRGHLVGATVGGHPFRLDVARLPRGTLVVGTSVAPLNDLRGMLLGIEGALLPLMGAVFFLMATVIGRGAAAPIERARKDQLDFTADASHELRTPLSVIEAEVSLALSKRRDAAEYERALERVSAESERLRAIVGDLLWLARLDLVPAAPGRTRVDLAAIVRETADRFAPVAARKGMRIACATPAEALVEAPPDWLERLVSVLVDNACRYSDEHGTVELSVRVAAGRVALTIDDSGPGIDPDERDQVLRRFHRASATPGGAGLGLAIADAIVRGTGGSWSIGTAPIGGARVEVSWPLPRRAGGQAGAGEPLRSLMAGSPSRRGSQA